jgi:hypothetical protein
VELPVAVADFSKGISKGLLRLLSVNDDGSLVAMREATKI